MSSSQRSQFKVQCPGCNTNHHCQFFLFLILERHKPLPLVVTVFQTLDTGFEHVDNNFTGFIQHFIGAHTIFVVVIMCAIN